MHMENGWNKNSVGKEILFKSAVSVVSCAITIKRYCHCLNEGNLYQTLCAFEKDLGLHSLKPIENLNSKQKSISFRINEKK